MERLRSHRVTGFSLIELMVMIAIILIIMGMALPALANARIQALETGAQRAISTIHTAQAQYQSRYGRYASTLAESGPSTTGAPNASAEGLISRGLASGQKSGYKYSIQPTEVGLYNQRQPGGVWQYWKAHVLFGPVAYYTPELYGRAGFSRQSGG